MPRPSSRAPFVAREAQMDQLVAALARAADGEPSALLVGADAGVGKTRLLDHAAHVAAERGATVVVSHCVDLGDIGLPYLPFAEALATLRTTHAVVDDVAAARPALGRLLDAGAGAVRTDEQDQAERLQLFDGIAAALAGCGSPESPLVLMVEDLHWADPSSRDVLRFLIARLRAENLLIVASYRTDDLHRRHPLRPVLAELHRHPRVEQVDLLPFTAPELREFTTGLAGAPLPEDAFEQVRRRSEGNAYFAEELVEAGASEQALPWTLSDILHVRLDQADPSVQHLARLASASGRQVSERLLRAVAGHDPHFTAPGAFDVALREAVAHHVLALEGHKVAFRHALLSEAVYADLLPGEQVTVHRAYLKALSDDPSLGSAAARAHHALKAHDLPTALVASRDAARTAGSVLAPGEELRYLEQVLRLWEAVPDAEDRLGEDRVAVALAAASAAGRAGEGDRAVALARRVVEATADDPLRQASLRHVLSRYLLGIERIEEVLEHTGAALEILPTSPPSRDRAWTLAMHARAALNLDHDELAATEAAQAVEEARELGAPDIEADALTTLAVLEVADADKAAALLRQALERAQEADDLMTELRCWYNLAGNRYYAGDLDAAALLTREGREHAWNTGLAWTMYGIQLDLFDELVRYTQGDLAPSPPARAGTPEYSVASVAAVQLYAAVARGDEDVLERAKELRGKSGLLLDGQIALITGGCLVDALTWAGHHDEAVAVATEVIEHLGRYWSDYFLGRIWLSALALAALADAATVERLTGQDVGARVALGDELVAAAVTTADRGRPRGGVLGPEGRAWLARARAEHSRLTGENDPALWEETTRAFDYGYRYEVARSRWRWAEALLGTGERATAEIEAAQALEEAEAMGVRPLTEGVRALARRGRLDLPGLRRETSGVLTDRETEVLLLVAQGLSNRQIGEKLFISTKTVSVHVSNLLAKLGASGRAEAVSLAHQRGLIEV